MSLRRAYRGPALLALGLLGCRSAEPEAQEHGDLAELGRMLESGAEPVLGTQAEGAVPLESDPYALVEPAAVEPALEPVRQPLGFAQDPYIRFGERIIVRDFEDGTTQITKPYTMPPGKAEKLVQLIHALEPFDFRPRLHATPEMVVPPPDLEVVDYEVLSNWDEELYNNLLPVSDPGQVPRGATPIVLSDVIVITATYERLEQFEDFLDLFAAAGVPQIELEAKIIEVVESDSLDFGFNSSLTFGDANFVKGIDFNLPNLAEGTESILTLGAVQSSFAFDAVLEAIKTWDNVQIDSRPKTVVRAGGVAYVESTQEIPYFEIKTLTTTGEFTTSTVYKKVGVQLYISPRIIGTKMLALDVHLIGSQEVGTRATFAVTGGPVIETPVIAYRTAKTVVYLEPGQTLVIGGLTSQRERELINKVPILGDIPLIGLLFRSTFTRQEKQHVLFAISPRILQHSDFETEF